MSSTLEQVLSAYQVEVLSHLDRQVTVPVLDGMQRQGDVLWAPSEQAATTEYAAGTSIPVVSGENGGNTHAVYSSSKLYFDRGAGTATDLTLGTLTIPEGETAYLIHPEHGANGISAGTYTFTGQREQADELRRVQD